jgi:uncharacterized protein YjeT (DUF2065 family)
MERATEIFAAVFFSAIGLSHIAHPRAWVEFFMWLHKKGHAGVFVNGFLTLALGSFIVAFHNVWTGLPMLLTLIGWAKVLKGLLNFVTPQLALWALARVSFERGWQFRVGGLLALGLSALIWYMVWTH